MLLLYFSTASRAIASLSLLKGESTSAAQRSEVNNFILSRGGSMPALCKVCSHLTANWILKFTRNVVFRKSRVHLRATEVV